MADDSKGGGIFLCPCDSFVVSVFFQFSIETRSLFSGRDQGRNFKGLGNKTRGVENSKVMAKDRQPRDCFE